MSMDYGRMLYLIKMNQAVLFLNFQLKNLNMFRIDKMVPIDYSTRKTL